MKRIYLIFLFLITCKFAICQQIPQYSQYMFERYLYNPGYIGTYSNTIEAAIDIRDQMSRYEHNPITVNVGVHGPLRRNNWAIGGRVISDNIYPYNMVAIYGAVAHKLRLPTGVLSIGIEPGVMTFNIANDRKLHDKEDDVFEKDFFNSYLLPDLGAGLFYNTDHYYAGISALHILPLRFGYKRFKREKYARLYTNFFFTAGGYINISPDFRFEPSTLVKVLETGLSQVDLTAGFSFREIISAGLSYRTDQALIPFVRIILKGHIHISYSYDAYIDDLQKYGGRSHELLFRYLVPLDPLKKATVDPRYY